MQLGVYSLMQRLKTLCVCRCVGEILQLTAGGQTPYICCDRRKMGTDTPPVEPAVQALRKAWVIEGRCCWPRGGCGLSKKRCLSTSGFTGGHFHERGCVEVHFLGDGLFRCPPPGLPRATLHSESSIISKCKCRCGR